MPEAVKMIEIPGWRFVRPAISRFPIINRVLDEHSRLRGECVLLRREVSRLEKALRDLEGPCRADPPQRYFENRDRYVARDGCIDPERELPGFVLDSANNAKDMSRFYMFCLVFDQITKEGLSGQLAELGVYRGHTATLLAGHARRLNRTLYLLDTFDGFSEGDLIGIDKNVTMYFTDTSLEAVRAAVGEKNVVYVQGHFPDSATKLPSQETFCLVHIDCDLYAPIQSGLEYFYQRLVPGGFLVVHDYSSLHWPGAERAVDEFLRDKPEALVPIPDLSGTAIIRKSKNSS
jgi:O-methyltransferase